MILELIFTNEETKQVVFAIDKVVAIRWLTPSEFGLTMLDGSLARGRFKPGEKLEIIRKNDRKDSREKHGL